MTIKAAGARPPKKKAAHAPSAMMAVTQELYLLEFRSITYLKKMGRVRPALERPGLRTPILGWGPGEKLEINRPPRSKH